MIRACCLFFLVLLSMGQGEFLAQTRGDVPRSLAWDVASDPRNAALGGLDAAPLSGDGWSMTVHPCALDSSVERHVYTSYLDYFAGIKAASVAVPLSTANLRSSHVGIRFVSWGDFEGANAAGISTGSFSGGDYILQYGSSWRIDSSWTVGVTAWGGMRNLAQVNAGVAALDFAILRRSRNGRGALGLVVSNVGVQEDFSGVMPEGRLPHNVQLGWSQTFPNAPFTFHLRAQRLETWELAPEGTYDDTFDPLTGELIPNDTWVWGDQLFRHLSGGVSLKLGTQLRGYIGYNHQRQKDMAAAGRTGVNGMSLGFRGQFRSIQYALGRSVYHFAGASTHLALVLQWPQIRTKTHVQVP